MAWLEVQGHARNEIRNLVARMSVEEIGGIDSKWVKNMQIFLHSFHECKGVTRGDVIGGGNFT